MQLLYSVRLEMIQSWNLIKKKVTFDNNKNIVRSILIKINVVLCNLKIKLPIRHHTHNLKKRKVTRRCQPTTCYFLSDA